MSYRSPRLLYVVVCLSLLLSGCGAGPAKLSDYDRKAFDNAEPDLKQDWSRAQTAAGTNDYLVAILTLRTMLPRNLSAAQVKAVQTALAEYDARLMKAVKRGDPAAQKALETLESPGARLNR